MQPRSWKVRCYHLPRWHARRWVRTCASRPTVSLRRWANGWSSKYIVSLMALCFSFVVMLCFLPIQKVKLSYGDPFQQCGTSTEGFGCSESQSKAFTCRFTLQFSQIEVINNSNSISILSTKIFIWTKVNDRKGCEEVTGTLQGVPGRFHGV